jgi:hypothetical protein
MFIRSLAVSIILAGISVTAHAQEARAQLWKPAADTPFLQELNQTIRTETPVTHIALLGETVYAVLNGTLQRFDGSAFAPVDNAPASVTVLKSLGSALWLAAQNGVFRFDGAAFDHLGEHTVVDFCEHRGAVHAATGNAIFRYENNALVDAKPASGYQSNDTTVIMEDGSQVLTDPIDIGPIHGIASYNDTLYLLRPGGIALLDGPVLMTDPIDWGVYPSANLRALLSLGSRIYLATDRGVSELRGMALTTLRGADGLPSEDTTCLAAGFDGDLWIGTSTGAIRRTGDEFHYFGADHWLPGDGVNAIAVGESVVYIATNAGLGIIRYEPYTLAKKAAFFERSLEEWGHKRIGFVHLLYWSGGDDGEWIREISDNDGGHTAHYLAAMCFKYAATKDPAARREAVDSFEAMRWLQLITGTDGFFARSVHAVNVDKGELSRHGSGGLPAKWYPTEDGMWVWKGDTSSDEVNSHFYAVALFHDLVASDAQKKEAADHLARITRHIIDNGWVLRDMDGQPTRWGRWDPEYLLRPYGYESRGLNGMEAQTYVTTALALTGDAKFQAGLDQVLKWGYHRYTVRQKLTFPPESVVPWDDELAFRCYHPLIRYATDPDLRAIYLRSLERHWEVMRMQQVPFFNFVYGALTGHDCEVDKAAKHLREWSLDTVAHNYRNSHRNDLAPERGYVTYGLGTRGISPRNLIAEWGSRSAIEYDRFDGSRRVTPAVGWLEDYWMGRYYGFILPPDTKDRALTTIPDAPMVNRGAAPYAGPPRPKLPPVD